MKKDRNSARIISALYLIHICSEANAYIDPGTGSLLLQGLIAGVAAGAYTLKLYWYRIKSFFSPKNEKEEELEEE